MPYDIQHSCFSYIHIFMETWYHFYFTYILFAPLVCHSGMFPECFRPQESRQEYSPIQISVTESDLMLFISIEDLIPPVSPLHNDIQYIHKILNSGTFRRPTWRENRDSWPNLLHF